MNNVVDNEQLDTEILEHLLDQPTITLLRSVRRVARGDMVEVKGTV